MTLILPLQHKLHERLIAATYPIGQSAISTVLMIDYVDIPWILLVPRLQGVEEMHELEQEHRHLLIDEIASVTAGLQRVFSPVRINLADIGNRVAEMHIHIVARSHDDVFWPRVVWSQERKAYPSREAAAKMRERLIDACQELPTFTKLPMDHAFEAL